MDSSNQWMTQGYNGGLIRANNMGEIVSTSTSSPAVLSSSKQQPAAAAERKANNRPQKQQAALCPRCHSTNTKFCYYNNYSLTQPRYFCKTCRRYWTQGGTLRNVPVGGGSRKHKKSSTTTSSPQAQNFSAGNPNTIMMTREGQHLNLGFPAASPHHHLYHHNFELAKSSPASASSTPFAALELLRTTGLLANSGGIINSSNFNPTSGTSVAPAPDLNAISGFSFQELKPFSSILQPRGGGGIVQENGGRFMFPFGVMKQGGEASSTITANEVDDQHQNGSNKGQQLVSTNSNGFWNGMLGGTTTGEGSW